MAVTPQELGGELVESYNLMIKQGIAAVETGWEQTTAAAKQFAAVSQTEMEAAGKTWESVINDAHNRNEKLAGMFKDSAKFPSFGTAGFKPETEGLAGQLIEGEKALFQSWKEYLAGLEKRQAALLKGLSESNSRIIETSQELARSAAVYGEAFLEWSGAATNTISSSR